MDLGLAPRVVGLERPSLAPEGLDDADARQALLQDRQRLGNAIANRVVDTARAVVERPARGDQNR